MFSSIGFLISSLLNGENFPIKKTQKDASITALVGDVGGTNIRFALIKFTKTSETYETIKNKWYRTRDFKELNEAIIEFLSDVSKENWPLMARVGIAGIVFDNKNKISNIPEWPEVDGGDLGKKNNIKSFKFYNDFEIASYGVIKIKDEDLIQINNAKRYKGKPMSVLGVGTGIGVSFVGTVHHEHSDGTSSTTYHVFPGEGGHCQFSPITLEQQEYYNFLKSKYPYKGDHIALEYGLAGPALPYIYEFFKQRYPNLQEESQYNIEKEIDIERFASFQDFPRKEVLEYGKLKKDKLCQKVLDFFLEVYGHAIGDICVKTLCYGGVFLCGNISISLAEYILENKDRFMAEYLGRREYLRHGFEKIPIFIVKKEEIGILGAFAIAQQDFKSMVN